MTSIVKLTNILTWRKRLRSRIKTSTMGGGRGGKGSGKGTWKTNVQNKQDKGRGKKNTRVCVQTDRESVRNGPPLQGYPKLSTKETVSPCRLHSGGKKAINTSLSHHKCAASCSTHTHTQLQLRPEYELIIHHQCWCILTLRHRQGLLKSPLTLTAVGSAAHYCVRDARRSKCFSFSKKHLYQKNMDIHKPDIKGLVQL